MWPSRRSRYLCECRAKPSGVGRTARALADLGIYAAAAGRGAGEYCCFSLLAGANRPVADVLLSEALFIVLFWSAGQAATQMAAVESPLARTSVGSGLWLWLALCLLVCSDAIRRLTPQPVWRWLLNAQFWVIPLLILFSGDLNQLSLLKSTSTAEVFDNALAQHLTILFGTLIPALLLGVPLGMWCYRHTSRRAPSLPCSTLFRPSPPSPCLAC